MLQRPRSAALFALGASLIATAQTPPLAFTGDRSSGAAGGGFSILEFKPAMDDLMTMLVQPRHLKLYYAGQAKNWTLAGFELNELRQALARIGRTIPTYRNIGVDTAVSSIFAGFTLKSGRRRNQSRRDEAQFTTAYGQDDGRVQRLPRRHGASVPGDQGAASEQLSGPGISALSR